MRSITQNIRRTFLSGVLMLLLPVILTAQVPERKTYLPEYRMKQLFPTDITGTVPWYDMNPFPRDRNSYFQQNGILPADYSRSQSVYLLGQFSEVLYFALRIAEDRTLEVEDQDRDHLRFLSRIPALYGNSLTACLAGPSGRFVPAVRNEETRKALVTDLDEVIKTYDLAGVDLDWEFPRNDEEKQLHLEFMKDLREMLSPGGRTLSIAVTRTGTKLLPAESYTIPDTIHLMTYDYYGKHSTWEYTLEATEYMMARFDIPPEKLIVGLPFYGRIFDGFSPDYWKKTMNYRDIVREFAPAPSEDEAGGFYFNGPETIRKKMELVSSHSLKGVFIWEIGQDIPSRESLSRIILDYRS